MKYVISFRLLAHLLDYRAVARWALLPLKEPLFQTLSMEDMLALRDLHQLFALIEEVPAHAAHILRDHPVFVAVIALLKSPVHDLLEVLEVDSNHVFGVVRLMFSPATALLLTLTIKVLISTLLSPIMCQVETDHLDQDNDQKEEHRGGQQRQQHASQLIETFENELGLVRQHDEPSYAQSGRDDEAAHEYGQ